MVEPMPRHLELTAVYRKVPEGYIAFIEELPGANTRGRTLDEARANLREAAALVLQPNRTLAMQDIDQTSVIREPLRIAGPDPSI
jgi:predicted RNase H-like HicB family nuclease